MNAALEFRDVDILFPRERGRKGARALQEALVRLDAGASREEISEACGVIVGVAGASLAIMPDEICVMMGLSGSGKSTLMRAANGLTAVTRGQVLVNDANAPIDVGRCSAEDLQRLRRERIAMVFQQFGLLPWRTVAENVGFGLEVRGEPPAERQKIVTKQLELVGLSQWAERHVSELSGGMQQRVGLARAFATNADILLMDEPFSALDPLIRDKLQDELLALQERVKKTILFVSHDLDEALRLGDRISIMHHGRIVQTGSAQDIVLRPADDYVAEFVRHMNPLTVLTGAMIMRKCEQLDRVNGGLCLDDARRYQLKLDSRHAPVELRLNGQLHPLRVVGDDAVCAEHERAVIVAPASLSLQALIQLRRRTGHPVLLAEDGQVLGVCGETEIIGALAARDSGTTAK
ncbi:MAG: choline ABC transporter ATP-binding protein [Steroidobacteraceae bacterium]